VRVDENKPQIPQQQKSFWALFREFIGFLFTVVVVGDSLKVLKGKLRNLRVIHIDHLRVKKNKKGKTEREREKWKSQTQTPQHFEFQHKNIWNNSTFNR
jgi:predicted HAD superfamily phosphohydrolase YqeG